LAGAALRVARHCLNQANVAQQTGLLCALQLSLVACFCQHCRLASLTSNGACDKMLLLNFNHHLTKGLTHCIQARMDVTQCRERLHWKKTGKKGTTDIKPRGSTAAALLRLQAESRAGKAE